MPDYLDDESYVGVIFCIDESGSITEDNLRQTCDIILQSSQFFKKFHILKHSVDCPWYKTYDVETISEEDKNEICSQQVCGGTSHKHAFNRIKDICDNDENEISMIVVVSDLYSDILENKYLLPDCPVVWITCEDCDKTVESALSVDDVVINIIK